ncbi:hypothetical protein BDIM_18370 [Brevundimonas diminuta ATCC 11568]|nr:hypothetical protein BDIM_18370 [Brevundimonas diminuta ATCC 11568]
MNRNRAALRRPCQSPAQGPPRLALSGFFPYRRALSRASVLLRNVKGSGNSRPPRQEPSWTNYPVRPRRCPPRENAAWLFTSTRS